MASKSPNRRGAANERARRAAYHNTPRRAIAFPLWWIPVALVVLTLAFLLEYRWMPANAGSAAVIPAAPSVVISEVMTKNQSALTDERGKYPDWVELYNPTGSSVDLTGWTILDSADRPLGFTFPETTLASGECVVVFCSGNLKNTPGYPFHAPFALSAKGDSVKLYNREGALVDQVDVPKLLADQVYMRKDSTGAFETSYMYTPGATNTQSHHAQSPAQSGAATGALIISEIMPANKTHAQAADNGYYDYIEIANRGDASVNLAGYGLSDDENKPSRWRLPDVTIAPGESLLVYASGKNTAEGGELHANFKLSQQGEHCVLHDPDGRLLDRVDYPILSADRAYSRVQGTFTADYPATPGYSNDASGIAETERALNARNTYQVYINEAISSARKPNATKPVDDWLELYNASQAAVDLSGWGLSDDPAQPRKWRFPDGASIGAGQYLAIALSGANKASVAKSQYATNFKLSYTNGETVILSAPDGQLVDRLPMLAQKAAVSYGRMPGQNGYFYFETPTPGEANQSGYSDRAGAVTFSEQGGFYDAAISLTLTAEGNGSVYYTLDCTEPTAASTPYTGPIAIDKTTVVRARALGDGVLPSDTYTRTFLFEEKHTLPVVSLVADPAYLYDGDIGIYVKGNKYTDSNPLKSANYWRDWERAANVEYFGLNGEIILSQGTGMSLQGQYSRAEGQKAFKLTARNAYGANRFDAKLFPNRAYTSYKSFILRASGQDNDKTRMRDSILTALASDSNVMYQDTQLVAVYLNGEYWGHYNMRERIHKYSIAQWEGWENVDDISIVKGNDNVLQGSNDDFAKLLTWIKKHSLKDEQNLAYVAQRVDIDNYLDYVMIEMYTGNTDLLNVKRYRSSSEGDHRWRWVLFDTDWAFYTDTNSFKRWLAKGGVGSGNKTDNSLFVALMQNTTVRDNFLRRLGKRMYESWRPEIVLQMIDARYQELEPEMLRHVKKWGPSMSTWTSQVKKFREYASTRPKKLLGYIRAELNWSTEQMRAYFGEIMTEIGV